MEGDIRLTKFLGHYGGAAATLKPSQPKWLLDLAGNGAESGTEVGSDQGERRNGGDRDQRGN